MKPKLLSLLVVLMAMATQAQNSKINVLSSLKPIGMDNKFQKEIRAQEFVFPKRIHEMYVDTLTGYITIKLRKLSKNGKVLSIAGTVLVFDKTTNTVKWDKNMEFTSSDIQSYQNFMTHTSGNKLNAINIENGDKLWTIKHDLYYIDQQQNIGIGYSYEGFAGNLHMLEGLNLITGATLWTKELNRSYGWNSIKTLNDSTLLIAASGLHSLNIHTGKGWDYNTITGKKDYTETIAKNAVGVTLGILTGTFVTSTGTNVVRDVVSNVVMDSAYLYMASKEAVAKLDKESGHVLWTYPLPEDMSSTSYLVKRDSLLCLINTGYAHWGGKNIDFGTPFLLGLNSKTGTQRFYTILSEKKDPMTHFKIEEDRLDIAFKDRIASYGLYDGLQLSLKKFNTEALGELTSFVGDRLYVKSGDHGYSPLQVLDSTKTYIHTNTSTILALDQDCNITDSYDYKELYYRYGHFKDYKLLVKDGQTIVLDAHNTERATLNVSYKAFSIGNTLYDFQDERLLVVDLSTLLETDPNPEGF